MTDENKEDKVASESLQETQPVQDVQPEAQHMPPPEAGHMPPPPPAGAGAPPHGAPHHHPPHVAPLQELTGGMKFGWAVIGFVLGWVAILLAWLVSADKAPAVKKDAIKFSLIGFIVACIVCIVATFLFGGIIASMAMGMASSGCPVYYGMI